MQHVLLPQSGFRATVCPSKHDYAVKVLALARNSSSSRDVHRSRGSPCCHSTATAAGSSREVAAAGQNAAQKRAHKQQPQEVDAALRAAQELLDSIVAGGGAPTMASVDLGYTEYTDFAYACDDSGCVLAVQQDQQQSPKAPFVKLLSGAGWSLGMLPMSQAFETAAFESTETSDNLDYQSNSNHEPSFACIVSGSSWRVLLSSVEMSEFVHMLAQLRMAVASLQYQGLWRPAKGDRPPSKAKWETADVCLTAIHCPSEPGFQLAIAFTAQGRTISTSWSPEVTADAIKQLDEELNLRPLAARGT